MCYMCVCVCVPGVCVCVCVSGVCVCVCVSGVGVCVWCRGVCPCVSGVGVCLCVCTRARCVCSRPALPPAVCVGGVGALGTLWPGGAGLLAVALGGVTLLCPLLLVRLQRHKDNIQGPWDEAEILEDLSRFLHTYTRTHIHTHKVTPSLRMQENNPLSTTGRRA